MMFLKLMTDGGPVMWILLTASIIALIVFLIKLFQFHRDEVNVRELVAGLTNVLKRNGYVEAVTLCDNTPGPTARVLGAAILAAERNDGDIEKTVEDAGLEEIPKLERMLGLLSTIGYVAPLLGLLGTVLGMMEVFHIILSTQNVAAGELAGGVSKALIATAAGFSLAIPCYVAYNYLLSRMNHILIDMEKAASEILAFFRRQDLDK